MTVIIASLALLGATIFVLFFVVTVLLTILNEKGDPEERISQVGEKLMDALVELFIVVPALLIAAGIATVSHFATYYQYYIGIGLFVIGSTVATTYHQDILSISDQQNTHFAQPIYNEGVIPVMRLLNMIYDIVICWWNAVWHTQRLIYTGIGNLAFNCEKANFQNTVDKAIKAIEAPFVSLERFIENDGKGDFDVVTIVLTFTNFTASFEPSLDCICQSLSFTWDFVFNVTQSIDLASGLDRLVNAYIEYARVIIGFLIDLFNTLPHPFACNQTNPQDKLNCQIWRPPKFQPVFDLLTQGAFYLARWIDIILDKLYNTFFDNLSSFRLPPIAKLLSGPVGVLLQILSIAIDVIVHFDLVFAVEVEYLKYVNVTFPFEPALNISEGLNEFFVSFNLTTTDDLGCALGNGTEVIIRGFNFSVAVTQQVLFNFTGVVLFTRDYDFSFIISSWNNAVLCTINFFRSINQYMGDYVQWFFLALQQAAQTVLQALIHIHDFKQFLGHEMRPLFNQFTSYVDSSAVAAGDVFRQFDHIYPFCRPFPSQFPVDKTDNGLRDDGFFCCLGGVVQAFILLLSDLLDTLFNLIIELIAKNQNFAQISGILLNNLTTSVLPDQENLFDSAGCLAASMFVHAVCPKDGTQSLSEVFRLLYFSLIDFLGIPLRVIVVVLQAVNTIETNPNAVPDDLDAIVCNFTIGMYDNTIVLAAQAVRQFGNALACMFGSKYNTFTNQVWAIYGTDNTNDQENMRAMLCEIGDAIVSFVQGIVRIFKTIVGDIEKFINFVDCAFHAFINLEDCFFGVQCIRLDTCAEGDPGCITIFPGIHLKFYAGSQFCSGLFFPLPGFLFKGGTCITDFVNDIFVNCDAPFARKSIRNIEDEHNWLLDIDNDFAFPELRSPNKSSSYRRDDQYEIDDQHLANVMAGFNGSCIHLYNLMERSKNDSDLHTLARKQFDSCMISVIISTFLNNAIGLSEYGVIFDNESFYDSGSFFKNAWRLTDVMSPIIFYQIQKASLESGLNIDEINEKWDAYVEAHNITNNLTRIIGSNVNSFTDKIFEYFDNIWHRINLRNAKDERPEYTRLWEATKTLSRHAYTFTWHIFMKPGGFYDLAFETYYEVPGERLSLLEALEIGVNGTKIDTSRSHPAIELLRNLSLSLDRGIQNTKEYFSKVFEVRSERVRRNRAVFFDIANAIGSAYTEEKKKSWEYYAVRKGYIPPSDPKKQLMIKVFEDEESDKISSSSSSTISSRRASDLNPEICVPNTMECLHCTLLRLIINDITSAVCDCIEESRHGINITLLNIKQDQLLPIIADIPESVNTGSKQNTTRAQNASSSGEFNLNIAVLDVYHFILRIDFIQLVDTLGDFLTNTDSNSTNSVFYYINLIFVCDFKTHTKLISGVGLPLGLLYTAGVYIALTVLSITVFSFSSQFMIYFWLTYPFAAFAAAYIWSPICLPSLPQSLADDLFKMFVALQQPCIPWNDFLPGLTTDVCPGANQDYKRSFLNCEKAPYSFDDGFRNLFLLFELVAPEVNQYFLTTTFVLTDWIRVVFQDDLTFDFPSGQVPDVYRSCFYVTSGNFAALGFTSVLSVVLLVLFVYIAFKVVQSLLRLITLLFILFIKNATSGSEFTGSNVYYTKGERYSQMEYIGSLNDPKSSSIETSKTKESRQELSKRRIKSIFFNEEFQLNPEILKSIEKKD